jgi:GntR family transcriptional regulator
LSASQLALTRGERVVRIRRVRLAGGFPLYFDETYLPLEIGKKIITNNLKVEPIFSLQIRFSADRCGVQVGRSGR